MKHGEMLGKMIVLATNAHAGQFDKGGRPYILHPLAVMQLTGSDDEEVLAVAVLHDVVEDCNETWEGLIKAGATENVVLAVMALTKMPGQTYSEYKEAVKANKIATLVKMADLKHNGDFRRLKGVTDKDTKRMAKYMIFFAELEAHARERGWI